jgi:hypothetical protein
MSEQNPSRKSPLPAALMAAALVAGCGGGGSSGGGNVLPPPGPGPGPWGPPTTLAANAALATAPQVAVGGDGVATVCWSQAGLTGAVPNNTPFIGLARSTSGTGWSTAQPSPSLGSSATTQVALTGAAAGATATSCVFRQRDAADQLRALVVPAQGVPAIDTLGARPAMEQVVFAAGPDGTQAAAWVENSQVWFVMRRGNTAWSQPSPIQSNVAAVGSQPSVAVAASGMVMLVWREEGSPNGILLGRTAILTAAAPTLGIELSVTPIATLPDKRRPRVIATTNGEFVALWEQSNAGGTAYLLHSNRYTGAVWLNVPGTVDSFNQTADIAQLHAGPSGAALAVWRRSGGIWASRLSGGNWSAPVQLSVGLGGTAEQLTSAVDGQGNLLAAWVQSGSSDLYYSQYAFGTGSPAAPVLLDNAPGAVTSPAIGVNAGGVAAVAWLQSVSGQTQPDLVARVAR